MWSDQSLMNNISSSGLAGSDRVEKEEVKGGRIDRGIWVSSALGGIYVSLTRGCEPEKVPLMTRHRYRPLSECFPQL